MRTLAEALASIKALEPDKSWPAEWRLTRRQGQLLALLARAKLEGEPGPLQACLANVGVRAR